MHSVRTIILAAVSRQFFVMCRKTNGFVLNKKRDFGRHFSGDRSNTYIRAADMFVRYMFEFSAPSVWLRKK